MDSSSGARTRRRRTPKGDEVAEWRYLKLAGCTTGTSGTLPDTVFSKIY